MARHFSSQGASELAHSQGGASRRANNDNAAPKLPFGIEEPLGLFRQFTGTRCFSSSVQLRTMRILRGASVMAAFAEDASSFIMRNLLPVDGAMSQEIISANNE
jgi:hypothetical protein